MGVLEALEGGKMWIETAVVFRRSLERLKRDGILIKDTVFYADANLTDSEGANKISRLPRTPLTYGEFLSVLAAIKKLSVAEYERVLQNLMQDDDIVVSKT